MFGIKYPVVQGGMIWNSGWKLASAVSNAGGLGLIGAGSMTPELLEEHITKARKATDKPFGVNIPLIYSHTDEFIRIIIDKGVKVVFSSAGSPKKHTPVLKEAGIKVFHVVSTPILAKKCEDAGVDGVVAEGFEAGGHNGREELTTLTLIPQVVDSVSIPVLAAGGISCGRQMAAAFALGAEGVQIGSLFALTKESSSHQAFKELCLNSSSADTVLALKKLIPVRLVRSRFCDEVLEAEERGASKEELSELLGKGRAKAGMFDGDLEKGELEIGQGVGMINELRSVQQVFDSLMAEFKNTVGKMRETEAISAS